jgi:hypothetical protein
MAKCDLTFEFPGEAAHIFRGGQTVQGKLHATAHEEVNCKSLTITHIWETHGRGNVASGDGESVEVFSGTLAAGEHRTFEFSVPLLDWPPSYHGNYLNIAHELQARIDIPWGFDVTAEYPIVLRATGSTEIDPTQVPGVPGNRSKFGCGVLVVVGAMFLLGSVLLLVPLILFAVLTGLLLGTFWLMGTYLPRRRVGDAQLTLEEQRVVAGQLIRGRFTMEPSKPLNCGGITVRLLGEEVCVSGSGSNRRTHRHELAEQRQQLVSAGQIPAGPQRYAIELPVPAEAAPTLKLQSNSIHWKLELRVDIPRWPDFAQTETIVVLPVPLDESDEATAAPAEATFDAEPSRVSEEPPGSAGDVVSFTETAHFLRSVEGDHEQIDRIVAAVRGLEFPLTAEIERTTLYASEEDRQYAYPNGRTALALHRPSGLQLTLYFPDRAADQLLEAGGRQWDGRATVMDYDFQHQRLQLRVGGR